MEHVVLHGLNKILDSYNSGIDVWISEILDSHSEDSKHIYGRWIESACNNEISIEYCKLYRLFPEYELYIRIKRHEIRIEDWERINDILNNPRISGLKNANVSWEVLSALSSLFNQYKRKFSFEIDRYNRQKLNDLFVFFKKLYKCCLVDYYVSGDDISMPKQKNFVLLISSATINQYEWEKKPKKDKRFKCEEVFRYLTTLELRVVKVSKKESWNLYEAVHLDLNDEGTKVDILCWPHTHKYRTLQTILYKARQVISSHFEVCQECRIPTYIKQYKKVIGNGVWEIFNPLSWSYSALMQSVEHSKICKDVLVNDKWAKYHSQNTAEIMMRIAYDLSFLYTMKQKHGNPLLGEEREKDTARLYSEMYRQTKKLIDPVDIRHASAIVAGCAILYGKIEISSTRKMADLLYEMASNLGWQIHEIGIKVPSKVGGFSIKKNARPTVKCKVNKETKNAIKEEVTAHPDDTEKLPPLKYCSEVVLENIRMGRTKTAVEKANTCLQGDELPIAVAYELVDLIEQTMRALPVFANTEERSKWQDWIRLWLENAQDADMNVILKCHELLSARNALAIEHMGELRNIELALAIGNVNERISDDASIIFRKIVDEKGIWAMGMAPGAVTIDELRVLFNRIYKWEKREICIISCVKLRHHISIICFRRSKDDKIAINCRMVPYDSSEIKDDIKKYLSSSTMVGRLRKLIRNIKEMTLSKNRSITMIAGDVEIQNIPWAEIFEPNILPCVIPSLTWAFVRSGKRNIEGKTVMSYVSCDLLPYYKKKKDIGVLVSQNWHLKIKQINRRTIDGLVLFAHGEERNNEGITESQIRLKENPISAEWISVGEKEWSRLPRARVVNMHVCNGGKQHHNKGLGDSAGLPINALKRRTNAVIAPVVKMNLSVAVSLQSRFNVIKKSMSVGDIMEQAYKEVPQSKKYNIYGFPWELAPKYVHISKRKHGQGNSSKDVTSLKS